MRKTLIATLVATVIAMNPTESYSATAAVLDTISAVGIGDPTVSAMAWRVKAKLRKRTRRMETGARRLGTAILTASSIVSGRTSERVANPWQYEGFKNFYRDSILKALPPVTRTVVQARADSIQSSIGSVARAAIGVGKLFGMVAPGWVGSILSFLETPLANSLDNANDKLKKRLLGENKNSDANWQAFTDSMVAKLRYYDRTFSGMARDVSASQAEWVAAHDDATAMRTKITERVNSLGAFVGLPPSQNLYADKNLADLIASAIDTVGKSLPQKERQEKILYRLSDLEDLLDEMPIREEIEAATQSVMSRFDKDIAFFEGLAGQKGGELETKRAQLAGEAAAWLKKSQAEYATKLRDDPWPDPPATTASLVPNPR